MTIEYADLEIALHERGGNTYAIEMRSLVPGAETSADLSTDEGCRAVIDPEALAAAADPDEYGRALAAALFADERVHGQFTTAREEARAASIPLRVRLTMGAPELHAVRWETLVDPDDAESRLALSPKVLLSRRPTSRDRERYRPRRRTDLRVLVAIANRTDVAPVNPSAEAHVVTTALGSIRSDVLPDFGGGRTERATLSTIRDRLSADRHDVLYLVAHGGIRNGVPRLWLDLEGGDDPGGEDSVDGARFADVIRQLDVRPRLVVLASCESAGTASGEALAAIGPMLASAGVPAVVAMQGEIKVETLRRFMSVFFRELADDGVIDRAVVEARNAVWNQDDWWAPALFMRLASGRIWSVGFGHGAAALENREGLRDNIRIGDCTPVLGPGLMEPILGSRTDLARSLAAEYGYPLADEDRNHLYRVEQYILTTKRIKQVHNARRKVLREQLLARHAAAIPADLAAVEYWDDVQLSGAIDAAIDAHLAATPDGPYRRLARLRLPVYVDTSTFDVMERALRLEPDTDPVGRVCPWNATVVDPEVHLYDDTPTREKPLVYHLFGRASMPKSLVIGEDGVFDFLLGLGRALPHIPPQLREGVVGTSLVFLGFQLDEPEFRAAIRYIFTREGRDQLRDQTHAAVQIEPDEDLVADVDLAVEYYDTYFTTHSFAPYWGTSADFMDEVWESLEEPG